MRIKYLNNIDEIRLAEFEPDQILIDSQTGKIYSDRAGIRLQPSSVGREVSSTRETFISDREDSSIVINDNNDIAVITNEGRFELNSILIEQQEEDRWLLRFGLYKKRFYLYSVVNEEVIISDIAPPSITSGTYNFDTEEASAIIINSPSGYTWTIEKPTPGANEYLIASSFLFVSSERLLTIGSALIGDTPSKVLNREKRKRDLILFKQEGIGTLPGRLMFDFKTNRLIELETDSLNGWSSNFIQPTEENETYAITVALNSNDVPSIIETAQWTQPALANPTGRDGVDGINAISYDIIVSSEVVYKDADVFSKQGKFKNNLTVQGEKTEGDLIENFGFIRFKYSTGNWTNLTSSTLNLINDTTSTFEYIEFELFETESDRASGTNPLDYHKIPVVLKGFGAVQVALDNDHAGVREDAQGQRTPVSISTNVVVYENHEIVNDLWTLETTAVASFGVSSVSIIDDGSLKSISIDSEDITENAGFVDVRLTRVGYDDIIKRFSFTLTTDGQSGVSIDEIIQYYAINNSSTAPPETENFNTTIVSPTSTNRFLWTYEAIQYSDNTEQITNKRVISVYGETGNTGVGIDSILEEYQLSDSPTTPPTGTWSSTPPTITTTEPYLWNRTTITYTDNETFTITVLIGAHGPKGDDGDPGLDGFNEARILLYRRQATQPNTPDISGTYNFTTSNWDIGPTITQSFTLDIPATNGNPLWVSAVSLASREETIVVVNKVGSSPVKLVEDGADGNNGLNVATAYIYKRTSSSTAPTDKPSGNSTYNFSTGVLTLPTITNGWTTTIPDSGARFLWVRLATAASTTNTDTILDSEWANAKKLSQDGVDGTSITGPDGSTVVNGTVFLKAPATPTPDTPTGSYNKTNNTYTFSGDWSRTIEFEAGSQDTYWRSDFSGIGDTDIITLSFTTPEPTINFSGLVTFTDINEPLSLENTNVTSIEGGLLSTVNIISSDVISGSIPKMRIGLNDQVISIGQATEGYEQNGIFLGYDSNDPKMSLVGSEGHLKWVNSKLDIEGDLGGNLGKIEIGAGINNPGPTGIRISEDGILGFKNGTTTFSIQAGSGDATFNGEITSTSGNIGGWNIHTNYLRAPSGVGIMKIRSGSNDVEYWSGPSSDDGAGYPTINGASKIGFNSQALGMYTRYTSTSRERIELMPGGIYYYSEGSGSGNTEKLLIQSQKNIELVSTGGSIWVRGNGSDLVQLRLGLGTLVSSKIAKKDIFELNQNDINDFIEKVEIKEFSYKKDNKKSISLIIEDEEEKNNPFSEILFTRDNKREKYNKWDDVPEWLKEYKNTPNLTEENGIYYFNPKTYDLSVLSSITLASVKQQNKKIKELENKIEELYKIIENLTKN